MKYSENFFSYIVFGFLIVTFAAVAGAKPGGIDRSFGDNGIRLTPHGNVSDIRGSALQPDGKSLFVGSLGLDFYVTRFNADGSLDNSFDGDGRATIAVSPQEDWGTGVFVQSDGKIVICGYSRDANAWRDFAVVRLHENGSLDTTFDGDGIQITSISSTDDFASAVTVQPDGKIVVAGQGVQDMMTMELVRYNVNGSLDSTFDNDGKVVAPFAEGAATSSAVSIQSDGKIVVAGGIGVGGQFFNGVFGLARFNTDGSPDSTFGTNGKVFADVRTGPAQQNTADELLIQPDGKVVAAGYSNSGIDSAYDFAVLRLNSNGTPDNSFGNAGKVVTVVGPGDDRATSLALQNDGKLVVGGDRRVSSQVRSALVRYNTDGTLDTLFGNNGIVHLSTEAEIGIGLLGLLPEGRIKAFMFGRFNATFVKFFEKGSVAADFDADGKTDVSIFRPSMAEWWINRSSNGTTFAAQFGAATDELAPGDYTGDGKSDITVWRPSSGEWFVLRSEDSSFFSFPFGTGGDTPMPADYDDDGKTDAAVFRPSSSSWFIRRSSDNGTTIEGFGADGDIPVSADYDSDGKSDIAIYRPSLGQWWIKRSTAGVIAFTFGTSTDKPVQGDYTGDGKADVAFWRPSTGEWYILRSEDFSYYSQPFGTTTDISSPGDYDGDGKFDPTVFRPSSATWFSQRSTAGTLIQQFGATGDRPVPNAFVQ